MKYIGLILLILISSLNTYAWQIHSQVVAGPKGEFRDTLALYCNPNELLCLRVCGDSTSCVKEQELCYNCLGTSNPLLRIVFTEIDRLYRGTASVVGFTVTAHTIFADHIFIAARSIYNFYTPVDNAIIRARFQELCKNDTRDPIIVMGKNAYNEPNSIKYIICNQNEGDHGMYVLEYDPQVQLRLSTYINEPQVQLRLSLSINNP
jgi:hypothetical protein